MPSASLESKSSGYRRFSGINSSLASSPPNRNHRIDRALSLGQDGHGPALPQSGSGPAPRSLAPRPLPGRAPIPSRDSSQDARVADVSNLRGSFVQGLSPYNGVGRLCPFCLLRCKLDNLLPSVSCIPGTMLNAATNIILFNPLSEQLCEVGVTTSPVLPKEMDTRG